jgi:hypothetical protein
MLVAWARGTDGNLFLLCRCTAFNLTFEELVDKAAPLDCVGVQEPLLQAKHLYKNFRKLAKFAQILGI